MHERHTGGLILHVFTERPPDVLKRPKFLFSRYICFITYKTNYPNHNPYHSPITIHPDAAQKKTSTPACELSLHCIEEERRNMEEKRTQLRIAKLYLKENSDGDTETLCELDVFLKGRQVKEWHCCLNTFCFCLTLLIFNLLFIQWLYIKVSLKELQCLLYIVQ
jgi:hypothetical protein